MEKNDWLGFKGRTVRQQRQPESESQVETMMPETEVKFKEEKGEYVMWRVGKNPYGQLEKSNYFIL